MRSGWFLSTWIAVVALATAGAAGDLEAPKAMPAAGTPADNGFVGIYADAAGTQPCATIAPGTVGTLYLLATLAGGTAAGFTGAEFRIEVTQPAGYHFVYEPPPGAIVLGNPMDLTPLDPFDVTGMNIAFGACQTAPRIPLGTLLVLNVSGGSTELHVKRRYRPSNPGSNFPLFVGCSPAYDQFAMRRCAVDATGSPIAFRAALNDPACTGARPCAADCDGAPCVTLTATATNPVCPGQPTTITATATNCATTSEDIDVFVEYELAGSFADVVPGASVTASRTYLQPGCGPADQLKPAVGAVARNAVCAEPFGAEIVRTLVCIPGCTPNHAPDCSGARASIATIWPPDGRLVAAKVEGVTDPDGDPVSIQIITVGQEELPGTYGRPDCPDAFIDGLNEVRLRAERETNGDGRVYRLAYRATDPEAAECDGTVYVCVPRKPEVACNGAGLGYVSTFCENPFRRREGWPRVTPQADGGVAIALQLDAEAEVRVEVFDVRGRRLASLGHGRFAAGEHVLGWDGRDAAGHDAARGIYFIRVHTAGEVATTRFVLVR